MHGDLSKSEIDEVLTQQYIGRIGCSVGDKPYIVPVAYSYDAASSSIYGMTGEGMKTDFLRKNPLVCFEVESVKDITHWKSVVAWGVFEELSGPDAKNAMHKYSEKLKSLVHSNDELLAKVSWDISHEDVPDKNAIIYRIKLTEKSGKFESFVASESHQR
ncbi:pyridoxamine 5'-phosphate oxidase family protein [Cytophagaceae bacterium ABcell3]|nr:pyridoxamine 5'-phosphate oxidase family protein [Cytophagaceae bacterium ABcell3]